MVPPIITAAAPLHLHHQTHSPSTTTASLRTVPIALLWPQHRAIATNHRFRLVKRVRPTAFGTSSATTRLSFTSFAAAVTVTGRAELDCRNASVAAAPCRCPESRHRQVQRIRLVDVFGVWPSPTACVL